MIFEVTVETSMKTRTYYMYGFELRDLFKKIEDTKEFIVGQKHYLPSQIKSVNTRIIYLSEVKKYKNTTSADTLAE